MTTFYIRLSTIQDIQALVNAATCVTYDVDLSSGRYVVDAKSIMGIYSLDLMKPIQLTAHTEDPSDLLEKISGIVVDAPQE